MATVTYPDQNRRTARARAAQPQVARPLTDIRVVHFHRRPYPGYYSIERVFETIRSYLPTGTVCEPVVCPYISHGIARRIANCLHAAFRRGTVNHITGDVTYLALALPRWRTVVTIHDCSAMDDLSGWRRTLFRLIWLEFPVRRSALVTVVSDFTKDQVLRYTSCDPAKIRVIPDPVPAEMAPAPQPFRADRPRILQMGTLPHKNLERTVLALQGVPCTLDIIGWLTPAQRSLLNDSGTPFSESHGLSDTEIAEKYRRCDLVTFISLQEGFGMPIIEANAVGRPVVTSNLHPMCDVAAGAACLVDPYDVASIRHGILRVINDDLYRSGLIASGHKNATRFAPGVIAAEYVQIYSEML